MPSRAYNLEQDVSETMALYLASVNKSTGSGAPNASNQDFEAEARAYDGLYLLYGLVYQLARELRPRSMDIIFGDSGDTTSPRHFVALLVARACAAARADLINGLHVDLELVVAGTNQLCLGIEAATGALKALKASMPIAAQHEKASQVTAANALAEEANAEVSPLAFSPGALAEPIIRLGDGSVGIGAIAELIATTVPGHAAFINPKVFKRVADGKSGQKLFNPAEDSTLPFKLSQKEDSKNGASKPLSFTIDLSDSAMHQQAYSFSQTSATEFSLTVPRSKIGVMLHVTWNRQSFHFASRQKVLASAEVEVTSLGDLVAMAVILQGRAERDIGDGGWPGTDERWEWQLENPAVKSMVTYLRFP